MTMFKETNHEKQQARFYTNLIYVYPKELPLGDTVK
jgi:hypothetical protein